jgi:hypothetical protein
MRYVDLTKDGFKDVVLWENGLIELPNGRKIEKPYATGQVSLPFGHRYGSRNVNLAKLVADNFLDPVEGATKVDFIDGDRMNCAASNLQYVARRPRRTKEQMRALRPEIIMLHTAGKSSYDIVQELDVNLNHVLDVVHDFEISLLQDQMLD